MIRGCLCQVLLIGLSIHFIILSSVVEIEAGQEPIATQNRFPLSFLFLTPRPSSAHLPCSGSIQSVAAFEHSSIYMDESNDQWEVLADMEVSIVDLSMLYGISSYLAVRLDAPFVSMTHGFMDGFLANFHDALGLPNYGREDRPENEFAYHIKKGDDIWIEGQAGGWHLADITLSAQVALFSLDWPMDWKSALLSSLKLPTGDSARGYGSGNMDLGLFLPSQWQYGRWLYYMMPGVIYRGTADTLGAHVASQNSFSFFMGGTYKYNETWCWIGQINYMSTPIEKTGISKVDDGAYVLTFGIRRNIRKNWDVELAFSEDVFTRAAPDFNVRFAVVLGYTKGGQ